MVTTADLDGDIEKLRGQIGELRSDLAEVRGQLGVLLGLVKYGGGVVGVLLLVQTVAIIVLAGRNLSVDASKDGLHVSGEQQVIAHPPPGPRIIVPAHAVHDTDGP